MSRETKARTRHQPNSMRDEAVAYARAGWPIFPCKENQKKPATKHGVNEATTNLEKIEQWWEENPDYNIGFHPGGADPGGVGSRDDSGNNETVRKIVATRASGRLLSDPALSLPSRSD